MCKHYQIKFFQIRVSALQTDRKAMWEGGGWKQKEEDEDKAEEEHPGIRCG